MYKNCCGKGEQTSKKVIKSIGQYEKDPADDPSISIATIAEVAQAVIDDEGPPIPMLIPHDEWEDHLDFDRNAVKLGFSNFVRPTMKSDIPRNELNTSHIIVSGDERLRTRIAIDLTLNRVEYI